MFQRKTLEGEHWRANKFKNMDGITLYDMYCINCNDILHYFCIKKPTLQTRGSPKGLRVRTNGIRVRSVRILGGTGFRAPRRWKSVRGFLFMKQYTRGGHRILNLRKARFSGEGGVHTNFISVRTRVKGSTRK